MDDNAALLERYRAIDAAELFAMKTRREPEGIQLDFKELRLADLSPGGSGEKNLKKAISGYANAIGGIVLWGVQEQRLSGRNASVFGEIKPVADAELVLKRLRELSTAATDPPVDGVLHEPVAVDGGAIVKTLVPGSEGGPHRTREESGQYYRRGGDCFRALWHHEIAEMFGRRARPQLDLVLSPCTLARSRAGSEYELPELNCGEVTLYVRNVGRGVGRYLEVSIWPGEPHHMYPDLNQLNPWSVVPIRNSAQHRYQCMPGSEFVLYPDDEVNMGRFFVTVLTERLQPIDAVALRYQLNADGMRTIRGTCQIETTTLGNGALFGMPGSLEKNDAINNIANGRTPYHRAVKKRFM